MYTTRTATIICSLTTCSYRYTSRAFIFQGREPILDRCDCSSRRTSSLTENIGNCCTIHPSRGSDECSPYASESQQCHRHDDFPGKHHQIHVKRRQTDSTARTASMEDIGIGPIHERRSGPVLRVQDLRDVRVHHMCMSVTSIFQELGC